ncbi:MAG: sortase [Bacilli bacterium]|nr:sortase [Bacilli bacterium]
MLVKRKKENKKKGFNKSHLIIVGSFLLIIIGISVIGFKYYNLNRIYQEEQVMIDSFIEEQKNIPINETYVEESVVEELKEEPKSEEKVSTPNYIAVLEIPKINLKKGLFDKSSSNNNVDKNIQILKESDMPDKLNGNFILAGHSGNGRIAYFKNLNKLEIGDIAYVYYNGGRYGYKLVNSYEIDKTGKANIVRNANKTTMTLVTCKHNTEKQIIFIFELMEDIENE